MHKIVSVQKESFLKMEILLKRYWFLSNKTDLRDDSELQKFVSFLENLCGDYMVRFSLFSWSLNVYSDGKKVYKIKRCTDSLGNGETFKGILVTTYLTGSKSPEPYAGCGTIKTSDSRYEMTGKAEKFHTNLHAKKNQNLEEEILERFQLINFNLPLAQCVPVSHPVAFYCSG